MEVHEIITTLTTRGAKIEVSDNSLKVNATKGIITPELNQLIKIHKSDIIDFLRRSRNAIVPAPKKDYYKLSSAQKRLYFVYELNKTSVAYNEPRFFMLDGALNKEKLVSAFRKLIQRHEILRTSFEVINEQPVQRISASVDFDIEFLHSKDPQYAIEDFVRPFDLSAAPLIRVSVLEMEMNKSLLMVDIHHIVTDGVSQRILISDFLALFNGEELTKLSLQYKDFAEWEQGMKQKQELGGQKLFWAREFSETPPILNLPTDFARPLIKTFEGDIVKFGLGTEVSKQLRLLADSENSTLFVIALAIYSVFLAKLGNQDDVVIGTVTAGRQNIDLEDMMGMFVNTLPLRVRPTGKLTFKEFVSQLRSKTFGWFDNQGYQYEELIEDLQFDRDTSRNPLFDVMFIFQNLQQSEFKIPGIVLRPYVHNSTSSKFDLTLSVIESDDELLLSFEYSTHLFKTETLERFIGYFKEIVYKIIKHPDIKICDIDILSETERHTLISVFNETTLPIMEEETIVSLFETRVFTDPDKIAIVYEDVRLTYRELNQKSNRLAHYLRSQYSVKAEDVIGIMMERSDLMLVGILGILKSGAAYLPIDTNYPRDRTEYVLSDSGTSILIVAGKSIDVQFDGVMISLDEFDQTSTHDLNPSHVNLPQNLCYLIYTSGSTGLPKGVMISHRNVVNFFEGMNQNIPVTTEDSLLAITSISFDISVLELLWTLCNGVEVIIHPSDVALSGLDRYVEDDRAIDFSLFFFSSYNNNDPVKYNLLLESVKYADEAGFAAVWTPERHFHEFGGLYPNPSVISAALAMITKQIELRSGSVVSPLHDPIRIAEEWAVVDNLSNGRVSLSFASGWNPNDFVLSNASYKDRYRTMYEQIDIVRKLWRGEKVKRKNGLSHETEFRVFPSPLQHELPVWVTAGGSEDTFTSAGKIGANILTHLLGQDIEDLSRKIKLYRQARIQHGYTEPGKVAVMLHAYIGDDITEVEKIVERPFVEYLKSSIGLSKVILEEAGFKEEDLTDELKDTVLRNSFKRYYETSSLIGTKNSCGKIIQKLKEIEVDEIACLVDFGMNEKQVMESLVHLRAMKKLYTPKNLSAHKQVTMMQSTPSFVSLLKDDPLSRKFLKSLRAVLIGGEALPLALIQAIKSDYRLKIYNMYGPTETTIWSCMYSFDDPVERITIGKPIANTQIYILNEAFQLLPIGVAGDLYIGGYGLSRGYWKKDELTKERFISNPFIKNEKIYKTGDVARWLPDGNIEFMGRNDHQVKIRGYRIELGEIETNILKLDGIADAVVIARQPKDSSEKHLVSYFISNVKIDHAQLREYLAKRLPYYMIPKFFVQLTKFPLTPNGKLDRKSLPDPEIKDVSTYVPPKTTAERLLVEVWSKVLGREHIGITDNFFSVGGDSIKSIQIISRVRNAGYELSVKDIFTIQNIRDLSMKLKPITTVSDQSVITGRTLLTPIQRWFFEGPLEAKHHFNQSVLLSFAGGVSKEIIQRIFGKIQEHHDALRTVFRRVDGKIEAETLGIDQPLFLEEFILTDQYASTEMLTIANRIQSEISLEMGPLMRLALFQLKDESRLLIVIHHLVVDGISWRILFEDIETLYQQTKQRLQLALPAKTDSFKSWSQNIVEYTKGRSFDKAIAYWKSVLSEPESLIPQDNHGTRSCLGDSERDTLVLSRDYTQKILTEVHSTFGTQINDILLAGLVVSVRKVFGVDTMTIDMESHGREEIGKRINVDRTIGWFSSIYPVRLECNTKTLSGTIRQVKEILRNVPRNGIDYLIGKYITPDKLGQGIHRSHNSQVFFNYLGQFDSDTRNNSYTIMNEATGEAISPDEQWNYDWDILGMVNEGQLSLRFMYSTHQYNKTTMLPLLEGYKQALQDIVDYCCFHSKRVLTPSDLTYKGLSIHDVEHLQHLYDLEDVYTLSPMQEGMLFQTLLSAQSDNYFNQVTYKITGDLNVDILRKSLRDLVKRHAVLRTIFVHDTYDVPLEIVTKECAPNFIYHDVSEECFKSSSSNVLQRYQRKDREQKFKLDEGPLLRLTVLKTEVNGFEFIWSYHHILMDGWSMGTVIGDFKEIYETNIQGVPYLSPAPIPYSRYISWLEDKERQSAADYWRQYLDQYENIASLPKSEHAGSEDAYDLAFHSLVIPSDRTALLQQMSRDCGATLNSVITVAWGILLMKYNNSEDVVFGSVVSGRPAEIEGIESIVGLFINTVPVRIRSVDNSSVEDLFRDFQDVAIEMEHHQFEPLSRTQSQSELGRGLLDHILVFENFPFEKLAGDEGSADRQSGYRITEAEVFEQTNYDLSIVIFPGQDLLVRFDYNADRFERETIERISVCFDRILGQIVANPKLKVSEIQILSELDRHELLHTFNNTDVFYPTKETIISLFEKQCSSSPTNCALICGGKTYSYRDLQERSNQIAHFLQKMRGVQPGDLVAIMLEREDYLIPCIFAILKIGAAYVPIDPLFPVERINSILEDSEVDVVISRGRYLIDKMIPVPGLVNLDSAESYFNEFSGEFSYSELSSSALAYVIYTSGSTGKPKGVMIEHHSVVNRILWMQRKYPIDASDVLMQKTPVVFDVSVWELFWWSITGAALFLLKPDGEKDPLEIVDAIDKHRVTVIHFVPTMFNAFLKQVDEDRPFDRLRTLKYVFTSGEALKPGHVSAFKQLLYTHCDTRLINLYGPTEATVDVSYYECDCDNPDSVVPIGRPIDNIRLYILDRNDNLSPVGIAGELCIAGVGLARGYLNNDQLTQSKFVTISLGGGVRIYKTGDLARWKTDGNIEYLGRIDHQVKLRGYRIELSEIEYHLMRYPAVKEAIVLAKGADGDKFLAAYFVADVMIETVELKDYLSQKLPEYMIPACFVQLDVIPLTVNGKLDRKALPEPQFQVSVNFIVPETKEERLLAEIWSKVLGVQGIGLTTNFFAVGGDSIKSIQISSLLRRRGYEATVKDIVSCLTIKSLSKRIKKILVASDQSAMSGDVPLTPIQNWFFNSPLVVKEHYNQSVLINFPQGISEKAVLAIFTKLQHHHDTLRLVFQHEGGKMVQKYADFDLPVFLEVHDLTTSNSQHAELTSVAEGIQSGITLSKGPLMRLGLFHMTGGSRLLIVIHHLVIDGVSWRILFEDIESLYVQLQNGHSLSLPLKSDSYQSWSNHLRRYCENPRFRKSREWWRLALQTKTSLIPRDYPVGEFSLVHRKREAFNINENLTSKLLSEVHVPFKTQINEILLVAFYLALNKQFGCESISIDVEGHGRESLGQGENVSRTVGWFTTIYPVILFSNDLTISGVIKHVKELLRNIPNKGIDYLLDVFSDESVDFQARNKPRSSNVIFNYLGQFDSDTSGKSYFISSEDKGSDFSKSEVSLYDWEISGLVTNGRLEMSLGYSDAQYLPGNIQRLMASFRDILLEVIEYCCAYQGTVPTPSDFSYKGLSQREVEALSQRFSFDDVYVLSPMQENMLFHALYDSEADHYFQQLVCSIHGDLDINLTRQSFDHLVSRYDVLRTAFLHQGYARPIQVVVKDRPIDFQFEDIREACKSEDRQKIIESRKQRDKSRKFDLSEDALMRLYVLQTGDEEYEFIWSHHHIIMDGWCMGIIANEFKVVYANLKRGSAIKLAEAIPYSRYIKWLENFDSPGAALYWDSYLANYDTAAVLPKHDFLEKNARSAELRSRQLVISDAQRKLVNQVSLKFGVTLSCLLQSVWGILLMRYNNAKDVVFGLVVSGRNSEVEGIESMVGLFVNTIPVRIKVEDETTIADLLRKVQASALESEQHHYYPLSDIQSSSELGNGLFSHIVVIENFPVGEEIRSSRLSKSEFEFGEVEFNERTNYDLTVVVIPGDEIKVRIDYDPSVHSDGLIDSVLMQFERILEQVISKPDIQVRHLQILSKDESFHLLNQFNGTSAYYPKQETVLSLFERKAKEFPNNVAIKYEDVTISYEDLDKMAGGIARYLMRSASVKKGDVVGVMLQRDEWLVPTILGILKAHAAYLPIDPTYPQKRVAAIIHDANLKFLITRGALPLGVISSSVTCINLDVVIQDIVHNNSSLPDPYVDAGALAYVIYTSGSTGAPKGVMVEHGALMNYVYWASRFYVRSTTATFALYTSISFDLTITSIFVPLITGGCILVYNENANDALIEKVINGDADIIKLTPSHLKVIQNTRYVNARSLHKQLILIVGGEQLETSLVNNIYDKFQGNVIIYNEYGPTEATVGCMIFNVQNREVSPVAPIGVPISNTRIYLLDRNLSPVPDYVNAEVYIAGDGLAKGYLSNAKATQERFIDDPFVAGDRMYKTGDLARRRSDGNIIFAGRADDQVKIRGFRVELEEVRNRLLQHDLIKDVAVLLGSVEQEQHLIAYYATESPISVSELREFMLQSLPGYMIPAFFVHLPTIPLTVNGKLDRKALPQPTPNLNLAHQSPMNRTQLKLIKLWSEVLKINQEQIGLHSSFFELGGHSIRAIHLQNLILQHFSVKVDLKTIFDHPSIERLSTFIQETESETARVIPRIGKQEYYLSSSAQQRLFNEQLAYPDGLTSNISAVYQINIELDTANLVRSFQQLVDRHESLRTRFLVVDEEIVQRIDENVVFVLEELAGEFDTFSDALRAFIRPFDLSISPLFRCSLWCSPTHGNLLLVDIHHIICDGVSLNILMNEFKRCFDGVIGTRQKRLQYSDYSHWQRGRSTELVKQRKFWSQQLSGELSVLNLPVLKDRESVVIYSGARKNLTISPSVHAMIKDFAAKSEVSGFMLLLSVYYILLSKISGNDDIIIGTDSMGRSSPELQDVVGTFVNVLPLRVKVDNSLSFSEFLKSVKGSVIESFNNQDFQFDDMYGLIRDTGRGGIVKVYFSYANFLESDATVVDSRFVALDVKEIRTTTRYELELAVTDQNQILSLDFLYSVDLYESDTVDLFRKYYYNVLLSVLADETILLGNVELETAVGDLKK